MTKRLLASTLALAILATACSGGGGEAANCEEIAVQTIDLLQELIDDVDAEFESMSIEEFIENGDNLPSIESFREESAAIDARSQELDCPQEEIAAGVAARVGDLTAETQLGRFVINLLTTGNL
jgi:hypothetical protein